MKNNKHPSDLFEDSWNITQMTEKLKTNDMPTFQLDKLEFHISGTCNLKCPFCYGSDFAPKERMFLDKNVMYKSLDEVKEINPFIVLAGMYSEPLLHPDFDDIITHIGACGYRFGIYSNGFLLTDANSQDIVTAASKNTKDKPSYISFNISSSIVINQFEKQLDKIKRLAEMRKDTNLVINATLLSLEDKNSYNYMREVVTKLENIGVDNIRLSLPWGSQKLGTIEGLDVLRRVEELSDKITIRYNRDFDKCYAMAMAMSISHDGSVYPCPAVCSPLFKHRYSYGSMYDDNILDLWRGKEHCKLYNKFDPRKEKCICCPMDARFNVFCAELKK